MGRGNFFGGSNCGGFMPNGQGGVAPMINNDANTAVIMQAVQRNGYDVQSLATALNTTTGNVIAAINGVSKEICGVGNQMGMTANQVLTAIMQGNNAIATQLAECCCKTNNNITAMDGNIKLAMCQQTGALQNAINNVAVGQERAVSSLAYATKDQTCDLHNAIKESTQTIVDGQKQQEMREMQNKIDSRVRKQYLQGFRNDFTNRGSGCSTYQSGIGWSAEQGGRYQVQASRDCNYSLQSIHRDS